jgi:hypothetical protein
LDELIDILYIGCSYIKDDFISQPIIFRGCERALQLALKAVMDAGTMILEDSGIHGPEDVLSSLAAKKVIPLWLYDNLGQYMESDKTGIGRESFYGSLGEYNSTLMHYKKYCLEYVI